MHMLSEPGNFTIVSFQYFWDRWPSSFNIEDLPMMESILWPFGESVLIKKVKYGLWVIADSLTISGVFTTGVLLQIWFPFKSFLAIYPKGGNMLSVKIQNSKCYLHVGLKN